MLSKKCRTVFRPISQFYNSQDCSHCGYIEKDNSLSQKLFVRQKCDYTDNVDNNDSKLLLKCFTMDTYSSDY